MHDINCASARHLEAFADIPQELADKIVTYRKKRKRIFHIDELCRDSLSFQLPFTTSVLDLSSIFMLFNLGFSFL
jgi:hypothetical protein